MPASAHLPPDFDGSRPICVVAGQRDYPVLAVEGIRRAGLPVRIIGFEGETREDLMDSFPESDREWVKVGQVGKFLKALKRLDAGYALFVGQVTPGKLFRGMTPDLKALAILAMLKERNAETIFGAIVKEVEGVGVRMLDARAFMDEHLATEGVMTGGRQRADREVVAFGVRQAREIARLDIGQGLVVRKGTVLAVEAFEGTDDMLSRANKYKTDQLVFVKTTKPRQNPYFDWPVFGMKTLETMRAAGMETAALEADRTVILHRQQVIEQARIWKIELLGYRVDAR